HVLRAMRIPAGKHTVEFRFDPPLARTGDTIDLICNVLLIGLFGFVIFKSTRNQPTDNPTIPEPVLPEPARPVSEAPLTGSPAVDRPKKRR
ncbi:MAG: hypothetical protein EOO39_30105, partial [Cytophagaceae bacterium]